MKTADKVVNQSKKIQLSNKQIMIEVGLLLISVFAVYFLLALISFDPADPGWSQTAWHEPIHNWGGAVGAYLSDMALQFFGFIAYAIPILVIMFSLQCMVHFYYHNHKPINYFSLSLRVIGILAFMFSATGFFSLNIYDLEQFQAGGILGDIVSGEVLPSFHHIGASILLFAISLACITLLTGISWFYIAEHIGIFVVIIATSMVYCVAFIFKRKEDKHNDVQESEPQLNIALDERDEYDQNTASTTAEHDRLLSTTEINLTDGTKQESEEAENLTFSSESSSPLLEDETELSHIIDENNPSQVFLDKEFQAPNEFSINPDYYSPIQLQQKEELNQIEQGEDCVQILIDNDNTSISNNTTTDQLPESIEEQIKSIKITKKNINDDLIHPLLQKNTRPIKKPTTPLPSLDLLTAPPAKQMKVDHNQLKVTAQLIEKSLADFRVKAKVVDYLPGPVITRFEIELAPGVKASRISALDRDLARSLSMPSVRVVEVIPGKPYIGIELPNQHRQTVYFREVLNSAQFSEAPSPLTIVLGKDIAGQSVVADLAKMPHLLVAGTTGSGKSVGVNAMILSILYKSQPEDVRFIMIDPKMLELSIYEGIPHLLTDVVTDMKDAANALNWCVNEMEKRYQLLSSLGVRNIAGYNEKIKLAEEMGRPIPDPLWRPGDSMDIEIPALEKLPYIVVMVDEFADLIMAVGKKVEELIARLAQKARAAGIHLVLATQRPSVDVITGLIKANIPTRIAFTVSSKIDSRTILDQMGAESLLGMGDMLYLAPNSSIPIRVHGAFVRDEEVHSVVQDWKARGIPAQYIENITTSSVDGESDGTDTNEEELDPIFDQVVAFVVDKRKASISSVQRQFRIGYNRAARIVEQMELQGIVSTPSHNGNREVLAPPSNPNYS